MSALRHSLPLLALVGCTEPVVLGQECGQGASCIVEVDAGAPSDASFDARARLDASDAGLDASEHDSYVAAPDDAAVWMPPGLENASFELTGGQPGDIAALSLPSNTEIAPWFSCQPVGAGPGALTGVRAESSVTVRSGGQDVVLTPHEGLTFISMQYYIAIFPPALVQQLATPLRSGTQYGFSAYVATSSPSAGLSLRVYGADAPCLDTATAPLLAESEPVVSAGWQRICVRFTPTSDQRYLMFVEHAADPISGDRLFLDDVRSVEACP